MNHSSKIFAAPDQALELLKIARLGQWAINSDGDNNPLIKIDTVTASILGLDNQSQSLSIADLLRICHEADRDRVEKTLSKLTGTAGLHESIEYRVINNPEHHWHWIRSFAKSYADSSGQIYVMGSTQEIQGDCALESVIAKVSEAKERVQIMLDATPLCCNFWDENFNNIDCNQEAADLFDLKSKQEYLDNFYRLSPEYQPDGQLSNEKAAQMIKQAFAGGRVT